MKRLVTSPVFMAIFAVIAAGLISVYVYLYQTQQNKGNSVLMVPEVQIGGPFELVNQDGQTVTEQDFLGKYLLVYFGFSYCPDVCPTDLAILGEAVSLMEQEDPERAKKVLPVFITIDPERDQPADVKDYVENFHDRMVGLTGSLEQIAQVAKSYRVYYAKGEPDEDGDYVMSHSAFTYMMGPDGKFMSMFKHGSQPAEMAQSTLSLVE